MLYPKDSPIRRMPDGGSGPESGYAAVEDGVFGPTLALRAEKTQNHYV